MNWVVGVDGGTFTDFCLFNRTTNEVVVHKVLSSPEDPRRRERRVIRLWSEAQFWQSANRIRSTPVSRPSRGLSGLRMRAKETSLKRLHRGKLTSYAR